MNVRLRVTWWVGIVALVLIAAVLLYSAALYVSGDPLGWHIGGGRVHSWYTDGRLAIVFTSLATDATVYDAVKLLEGQKLTAVRSVTIVDAAITDGSIDALASCRNMEVLRIERCRRVTNRAVGAISQMSSLRQLCLIDTGLTRGGLQPLRSLKQLEYLDVSGNMLVDEDVVGMLELKSLRFLLANDCKVSAEAETKVENALRERARSGDSGLLLKN